MGRWLIPGIGALVLAGAVAVGAVVWTQQGDGTTCDQAALVHALDEGLRQAEQQDKETWEIERPVGCGDADQEQAIAEMTRDWHMMPGGMMMRASKHPGS